MKRINIDPFRQTLYLTFDKEEYLYKRNQFKEPKFKEPVGDLDRTAGIASDEDGVHVVGIFDNQLATLVHELGHVVIKVLESCNIEITGKNSEMFCYLQDNLFEQALEEFKRLNDGKAI